MQTVPSPTNQPLESLASQQYLAPASDLGDAILHITCTKDGSHFIAEVYDKMESRIITDKSTGAQQVVDDVGPPASYYASTFIESRFKHGRRTLNRKGVYHPIYEVPITDYTVALINKAWTNPKIISDMAKPFFQKIFLREFLAEQNAKRTAEYKQNGKVPTGPWFDEHDSFLAQQQITLNSYQKTASYNSCHSKAYSLFCDPGTGKTAMMIRKLDHTIAHASRQTMTLILCPKTIRNNWINELAKFSQYGQAGSNQLFIVQLQGCNPTERYINVLEALSEAAIDPTKHIILIAGYESFVQTERLHNLEFDLCLLDEAHNIANPSTKRTKTLLANRSRFANVVIATGTPFRNTPFDIFTQLEFLGSGFSGFESYKAFKDFYGVYSDPSIFQKVRHLEGFQNIPLLQEKLAKHSFIIRKEEALPYLPKKTFSIQECNLAPEQYKVYMSLAEQLYAEIESYGPEPDSMTVRNILTRMLRLAQITSGFAAIDAKLSLDGDIESSKISRFDPNPKLDLLVKYLLGDQEDEIDGVLTDPYRKAIVWCCFKENLRMIHSRLQLEGIQSVMFHGTTEDKDDVVDIYNKSAECRVFIGIAASGGVGLNLVGFDPYHPELYRTNTTDTIIYSSNWSMVNRMQSIDRAHRHNTRVPQHIVDLLVPGSIDMDIYRRLNMKSEMSVSMQDIKNILTLMIPQVNGN